MFAEFRQPTGLYPGKLFQVKYRVSAAKNDPMNIRRVVHGLPGGLNVRISAPNSSNKSKLS